ncbi:MAG: hypothetical protein IT436_17320 [Phycisphaerales bacterium]|nr:hypothetical protein [Phycisphaerales bacterium]
MTTPNPATPDPIDPTWALPDAPTRGQPISAATFARLLTAAREGGWPAVWRTWAEDQTILETTGYNRPARKSTLAEFLRDKRPDLRALLEDAANVKRDRLLTDLETEIERIALGPGDVARDFGKDGRITRERFDKRNKLFAILQLLKANDRERYGDHRRVDVAGEVRHDHAHSINVGGFLVRPEEVQRLPPERAALLLELLTEVEQLRTENPNGYERERVRVLPAPQQPDSPVADEATGGPDLDAR